MPKRRTRSLPPPETTAFSQGGCLSGFLLPPLAVICVGLVLAWAMLAAGPDSVPSASARGAAAFDSTSIPLTGTISPVFQPEVRYWSDSILTWAASASLDPNLVATIMQIESCGDPLARSSAGAQGLFQVMPFHFALGEDPFVPATNAARGLAYLGRSLAAAGGNIRLALAGYNGGISLISRPESNWPAETQRYAYWGSGIYTEAIGGASASARLQEWLAAGGASLCRQAHRRLGITP